MAIKYAANGAANAGGHTKHTAKMGHIDDTVAAAKLPSNRLKKLKVSKTPAYVTKASMDPKGIFAK